MTYTIPWSGETGFRAELFEWLLPQLPEGDVNYLAPSIVEMNAPEMRIVTVLSFASRQGLSVPKEWRPKIVEEISSWAPLYGGDTEIFLEMFERDGFYV